MKDKETNKDFPFEKHGALFLDERCGCDRRKTSSPGYTYVSTVGWICRRENCRRNNDNDED